MMAAENFNATTGVKGSTVIVGLGKTGLSCARYLVQQGELDLAHERAEILAVDVLHRDVEAAVRLPDVVDVRDVRVVDGGSGADRRCDDGWFPRWRRAATALCARRAVRT